MKIDDASNPGNECRRKVANYHNSLLTIVHYLICIAFKFAISKMTVYVTLCMVKHIKETTRKIQKYLIKFFTFFRQNISVQSNIFLENFS